MIHSTAIIDATAELDTGVEVGPYSIIGPRVRIGKNTRIGPHVVIDGFTDIGQACTIFQFASLGAIPQDLKYRGEESRVVIGNNNTIREFVTINRGTAQAGGETRLGSNNLLMAYCHVAHDCRIGSHVVLANAATLAGHIEMEDHAIVGGLAAVHQFVRLGSYCIIGGCSGVSQDIPPYMMANGQRAELFGLNVEGLNRHRFPQESISNLKKAYHIIFRSGLALEKALEQAASEMQHSAEVQHLISFIRSSTRGVTRAYKKESSAR
jgi:UDP-N-acetylglucosamine acyltransferase